MVGFPHGIRVLIELADDESNRWREDHEHERDEQLSAPSAKTETAEDVRKSERRTRSATVDLGTGRRPHLLTLRGDRLSRVRERPLSLLRLTTESGR